MRLSRGSKNSKSHFHVCFANSVLFHTCVSFYNFLVMPTTHLGEWHHLGPAGKWDEVIHSCVFTDEKKEMLGSGEVSSMIDFRPVLQCLLDNAAVFMECILQGE